MAQASLASAATSVSEPATSAGADSTSSRRSCQEVASESPRSPRATIRGTVAASATRRWSIPGPAIPAST